MARTTVCLTGEKQLGNSLMMYAQDQKGILPGPIHLLLYQDTARLQKLSTPTTLWYEVNLPSFLTRYIGEKSRNAKLLDKVGSCPTASKIPVADDSDTSWSFTSSGPTMSPIPGPPPSITTATPPSSRSRASSPTSGPRCPTTSATRMPR